MSKGRITKRHLKEDEFLQVVMTSTAFLREHLQKIIIGAVVIAVVVGAAAFYTTYQHDQQAEAGVLFAQGRIAYQENNFDEALTHLTKLTEEYGSTQSGKEGLMFLGNIYFQKGEYDKAIETFETCARKFSRDDIFYISAQEGIAGCLEGQEKYDEAAAKYESIAKSAADESVITRNLMAAARAYEANGELAEAKEVCQRLVDNYPESKEFQTAQNKLVTYEFMAQSN